MDGFTDPSEYNSTFKWLVDLWEAKIEIARKYKQEVFGDDAEEIVRMYAGSHDFLFEDTYVKTSSGMRFVPGGGEDDAGGLRPTFGMTVNKAAELIQVYGPVLYHRNPVRTVTPRQVPQECVEALQAVDPNLAAFVLQDAMMTSTVRQIRASLMRAMLNYTPNEQPGGGLKYESRMAILEALLKGRGCVWTELSVSPSGTNRLVGSFYDSVDNLLIDPDATSLSDAKWIARKQVRPAWEVESEYNLKPGTLKPHVESYSAQAITQTEDAYRTKKKMGQSNDMVVIYEIFSKMGIGDKLAGSQSDGLPESQFRVQSRRAMEKRFDEFGPYVRLVVCKGCSYFLNLPPETRDSSEELSARLAWPIPFYEDGEWPVSCLDFHSNINIPWPISHLSFARGEMKAMDWIASFMMGKIRNTCRDFIAILESADEEVKRAVLSGGDLSLINLKGSAHKAINEVVQFLQHPQMNGDLLTCFNLAESLFEKRTGLTDLAYGMSPHQFRSASEANLKGDAVKARPDDMASKVEDWQTAMSRKEAMALRWLMTPEDVAPKLGNAFAQLWDMYVYSASIEEVCAELDYRIESGSAKKPNRDWEVSTLDESAHVILPMLQQLWQMGNPMPLNAWINKWAQSRDMDSSPFMVGPPPPPQPPAPQAPAAPAPEQQQAPPPAQPPVDQAPPQAGAISPEQLQAILGLLQGGGGMVGAGPLPSLMEPVGLPPIPPDFDEALGVPMY